MCSPRKSNDHFSIFTFYESKQMSLTQDLRWSLGRSIALQLQRQTDLLLCTINCFLQWDHLPNMAVGDLAFYYTLYLCITYTIWNKPKDQWSLVNIIIFIWRKESKASWQHFETSIRTHLISMVVDFWHFNVTFQVKKFVRQETKLGCIIYILHWSFRLPAYPCPIIPDNKL